MMPRRRPPPDIRWEQRRMRQNRELVTQQELMKLRNAAAARMRATRQEKPKCEN